MKNKKSQSKNESPNRESTKRATYLRAGLMTVATCSIFAAISLSCVDRTVVEKEEILFEDKCIERPKMKLNKKPLKKLKVPVNIQRNQPQPTLRKCQRITTAVREVPSVSMPEFAGVKGDVSQLGNRCGSGMSGALGFSMTMEQERNTEEYSLIEENVFKDAMQNPLSTFSIDVDRASYANVRRFLNQNNQLPPADAVRIEEMINYFDYDYAQPEGEDPFHVSMEFSNCPWNDEHRLVLIGLQGEEIETKDLPANNLVFLLDVSGSMSNYNKLPLIKSAMRLLVEKLRPEDRVSIVVYAGAAGIVLEPTSDKRDILDAINRLSSGGSTAGGAGIELAYKTAKKHFMKEGNNRVILATDGDFNVGVSSDDALVRLIEEKRDSGIFLTVLGFGNGNYKDSKMEQLANKGNGNYAYIDDILEAKKVLVTEMGGTLTTIAKDVKIQVEFNPAAVKSYRLIGYENRMLATEDFADDKKDAGELGAGHTVTALYEIIPSDSRESAASEGTLKYQKIELRPSDDLMTVKLRYKEPDGDTSKLIVQSVKNTAFQSLESMSNIGFASSVAEFGMLLRNSDYKGSSSYDALIRRARTTRGADEAGYRAEFIRLAEKAQLIDLRK